jgi:hypothetical protein
VVIYDVGLCLEVLHAGSEGGELALEDGLLRGVRPSQDDGRLLCAIRGDLGAEGGIEGGIV